MAIRQERHEGIQVCDVACCVLVVAWHGVAKKTRHAGIKRCAREELRAQGAEVTKLELVSTIMLLLHVPGACTLRDAYLAVPWYL